MTVGSPTSQTMTRRSTRVRARISILITSLDAAIPFSLLCETLMVNAHGCAAKVPQPLEIGMPVRLRVSPPPANKAGAPAPRDTREATARIVLCQQIGGSQPSWVAGIEMDNPGNIWGLTPAPEDWKGFDAGATALKPAAPAGRPAIELKMPVWPLASPAAKSAAPARASDDELKKQLAAQQETIAGLENRLAKSLASVPGVVREQLAEAQQETLAQTRTQLGAMLAESVQQQLPAQTEAIARLHERLAALESLPSAVREQLAETRASLASVGETVRKQIADTQQETLAQARTQLGAMLAESVQQQSPAQTEAIARLQERLAGLESLPSAVREQLAETRASLASVAETVRKQIADTQQETLAQARQQLIAMLAESAQQQSPAQTDAIAKLQERLSSLESVPETVRKQLADTQQETLAQARTQLGAMLAESVQKQLPAQTEAMARLQERLAGLESLPSAVREQLAEARAALASVTGTVRKQLADTQQETLAQARTQLSAMLAESAQQQSPVQTDAIAKLQERVAGLESLPTAVRKQLADTQQETLAQARTQLGAMLAESVQGQFTAQTGAIAKLQERLATLESLPSAVREQLAEARAALASVTGAVRKQFAEAQQQTLARAREELFAMLAESVQEQFTAQSNAIARLQQRLAAFESVPDEVRKQLADSQQQTLAQARGELGTTLAQSVQEHLAGQDDAIARLQQRLSSFESVPDAVRTQLADAQQQTLAQARGELAATLAEHLRPLQQELAVCRKQAEDGAQVRAAVAEQFEQLPWQIQQHTEAAFRALQDQARAELERIIAESRSQDAQESARRQALETSTQALQKELAQARETLESSMRGLHQRIQEPIAGAVEEALAQAGAEISAQLARELEALHDRGRMVADELRGASDLLRNEREATSAQLIASAAKREELQQWLAEQQAVYTQQAGRQFEQLAEQQTAYTNEVRQKLEQFASELAAHCSAALEKQIRTEVENQAERAEADLDQRLGPMLDRASDLSQEVLSLLGTLQRESERCQTQARALLEEKDSVDDWITERAAEFQKTFHDALVETTGQIRGRLNMAVEMIAEPVEKVRDQAAQQLQEQAGRQARQLREDADEAAERLRGLRRDLESTVRESLRAQAAETAATFGQEIAQAAQRSVDEWRSALAENLESIAGTLNQKLPGGEK